MFFLVILSKGYRRKVIVGIDGLPTGKYQVKNEVSERLDFIENRLYVYNT